MPHYLVQGRYTSDGWAALIKNPHDRTVAGIRCTKLVSTADAVELFQQAGSVEYPPPA